MEAKIREMIKDGDILFFRNGNKTTFYEMDRWKFSEFYDDNLLCEKNHEYDVVNIKRPYYEDIMYSDYDVHNMSRLALEIELIEKRLQVESLKKEMARKDEIIRIYGNCIDDMNVNKKTLVKEKGE